MSTQIRNGNKYTTTSQLQNLPASIQEIIGGIAQLQELSPQKVRQLVKAANVQEKELASWADYEHPVSDSYGRKLVYDGGYFEVMVMSWAAGDYSAIHDHGYTQWGAVQVFGAGEHAVFYVLDGEIRTLSRTRLKPGHVMAVGHELVHQMGNPGEENFLSLHIYGNYDRQESITADARLFDLAEGSIRRTSGGVFFALPEEQISSRKPAPRPDYPTWLRDTTEKIIRLQKMEKAGIPAANEQLEKLEASLFDAGRWEQLLEDIEEHTDAEGHTSHPVYWKLLTGELEKAASLQNKLLGSKAGSDAFGTYAALYDAVIGQPCLEGFMKKNLRFFREHYLPAIDQAEILSIGCGTGLAEAWMLEEMQIPRENLLGIDISEGMVAVAAGRIQAETGDALELDPAVKQWDVAYCGLNVFQYVDQPYLREVIRKTAAIVRPGGYFVGDFITPDHIRWYPNVLYAAEGNVISLRTPQLIEKNNHTFQRSRIMNLSKKGKQVRITNEGVHERYLAPMGRIRQYFEEAFTGGVELFDAISLQPIGEEADTSPSTRYLLIARTAAP